MTLPIYESSSHTISVPSQGNKGLYFERFFDRYTISPGKVSIEDGAKLTFLKPFRGPCGNNTQLTRQAWKQCALAEAVAGRGRIYSLNGHFVSGMGNSHPVENGLLWHYTLGVPYLTGSQVKGLVRSLLEQYYEGTDKGDILLRWFGSESKKLEEDKKQARTDDLPADGQQKTGNANHTGELIFFDALPVAPVKLDVDIMTPHMGKWYLDGGKIKNIDTDSDKIPADWHDPNPIPFLAVQEAKFLFTIARRQGSNLDIAEVFACLDQALEYLGVGAKTQVGYGYMAAYGKGEAYLDRARQSAELAQKILAEDGSEKIRLQEELQKRTFEEELRHKFEQFKHSGQIANAFSRNFNQLTQELGNEAMLFLCRLLEDEEKELLTEWKQSSHKNEQKAFKRVTRVLQESTP